jgi:hypothetical protein
VTSESHPTSTILRSSIAKVAVGGKQVIGPPSVQTQTGHGHQINVNKNNAGAIETIEVVCACGERILLRCDYDQN